MSIEVSMSTEEQVRLSITPLTPIDDTSTWVVGNAGIGGNAHDAIADDADMGQGFIPIAETCVVHVSSPMAASLGMAADAPVLIPEA